jgi:hypothetical protein
MTQNSQAPNPAVLNARTGAANVSGPDKQPTAENEHDARHNRVVNAHSTGGQPYTPADDPNAQRAGRTEEDGVEPTDQAEGERDEGAKETRVGRNPDQAEGDDDAAETGS